MLLLVPVDQVSGMLVLHVIVPHLAEQSFQVLSVRFHIEQWRIGSSIPNFGTNTFQTGRERVINTLQEHCSSTHYSQSFPSRMAMFS